MMQPSLTEEQEAKLTQALEIAQIFEEKAKQLSERGDAFAEKWEKRLLKANQSPAKNLAD